jgi:DNA invertase Pin-like site-specific DNA recombinase
MQLRELRDYCQRRGWEIASEYVDTGGSGSKASRPQLDRVMRDAGEHRFDCVLVWKASVAEFERSMIQERVKAGVRAAKSQGVSFGRPKVVFDRKRALDLKTGGHSLREIAGTLGVGRGTIERFLLSQNPN